MEIIFLIIIVAISANTFISLIKEVKQCLNIEKNGIKVSGTVQDVYLKSSPTGKIFRRTKHENIVVVGFDGQSLSDAGLPYDYPPAEVVVKNALFRKGDHFNCMYLPASGIMTSRHAVSPIYELAMGLTVSAGLGLFPLIAALGTVLPVLEIILDIIFMPLIGVFCIAIGFFCAFPLIRTQNDKVVTLFGEITHVEREPGEKKKRVLGYEYAFYYEDKFYRSPSPEVYKTYRRFWNIPMVGDPVTIYFNTETEEFSEKGNLSSRLLLGAAFFIVGLVIFVIAAS